MKRVILMLTMLVLGSLAVAQGFAIRGAFPFNLSSNKLGLEGELEYNAKLDANLTWGVRLSAQKIPLDGGDLTLIVPNGFIEYRVALQTATSAYGKAELGIGILPQFFPRVVLTGGFDSRYTLGGVEVIGQTSAYFDFIVTNRAKLGATGRFGVLLIPLVPYLAADINYEFYKSQFVPKVYAGSLLFLSPQFFLGLEGGTDSDPFVRLFFQFSQ
jgi:hypothetical protein